MTKIERLRAAYDEHDNGPIANAIIPLIDLVEKMAAALRFYDGYNPGGVPNIARKALSAFTIFNNESTTSHE